MLAKLSVRRYPPVQKIANNGRPCEFFSMIIRPALITLCALALLITGCGAPSKSQQDALTAYKAADYPTALASANDAAAKAQGTDKERSTLIAGLSEYALRRPDDATTYLLPLVESQDPEVAGTASWTLGSIAYDKGNYPKAITLLGNAAPKLKGDDAARAVSLQGDCYAKINKPADAKTQYAAAAALATDPSLKYSLESKATGAGMPAPAGPIIIGGRTVPTRPTVPVTPPPPGTRYVIQLGAFSTKTKADELAQQKNSVAVRAGLGSPLVQQRTDKSTGQSVFAVRLGNYSSRASAEQALARLGSGGTVMADLP